MSPQKVGDEGLGHCPGRWAPDVHQFIQPVCLDGSHHTGVAHTMQVSFLSMVDTCSPWGGTEEGHAVRGSYTVTTR